MSSIRDEASVAAARAEEAARSVIPAFGTPVLALPGTHLGRPHLPDPPRTAPRWPWRPSTLRARLTDLSWNYWWQAHYLDAIVDAGLRHQRRGSGDEAQAYRGLAHRVVRGVWLRNVGHITNRYYDDMAWLALAVQRLTELDRLLGAPPSDALGWASARLAAQLRQGHDADLGGGLWWNTHRDRKNVPATAPAALVLARGGDPASARTLVDWIYTHLHDTDSGLILDTIHVDGTLDRAVYSYNQGVVLGALLALGDGPSLARAQALIAAVDAGLRVASGGPLRTYGDGDGGLFTGILVRYLAAAALDPRVSAATRSVANELVHTTAEALWGGSVVRTSPRPARVFPDSTTAPADPQSRIELSTQVQAWTVLEAAARLA